MADRIAIIGGEPYAEWIERDGNAQRLFKAYRNKWPEGDTRCVALGDELYVRFSNGRPLHHYAQVATAMAMAGVDPISLYSFRLHHVYGDENILACYEYVNRHGETAVRVIKNIVRSRIARASHGKPTVEPLERTALRLFKRAGRPELNARYARIRKRLTATRAND